MVFREEHSAPFLLRAAAVPGMIGAASLACTRLRVWVALMGVVVSLAAPARAAQPGQHVILDGTRFTLEKPLGQPGTSSQTFLARSASGRLAAIKLAVPTGKYVAWAESTYAPESAMLMRLKGTAAIRTLG